MTGQAGEAASPLTELSCYENIALDFWDKERQCPLY